MIENVFVFVACGAKEHIDTLHFSLNALKCFSETPVVVVTDSSRNEIPVLHTNVIDIKTSENFTHHQASIILKTSLHKILPSGTNYCYLDSDVIAVDINVDKIFLQFVSPITFARDHCRLDEFSHFAVNCNCKSIYENDIKRFHEANKRYDETLGKEYLAILDELDELTQKNKRNKIVYFLHWIKYYLHKNYYAVNGNYRLEKKTGKWLNSSNEYIDEKYDRHNYIYEQTGLTWNAKINSYITNKGNDIFSLKCTHLHEQIKNDVGVQVQPDNWQHWNGGVFLFNNNSHDFMDFWHNATLSVFENKAWKTRDQGTLAATVWKYGLQQHPLLPIEFNFIVDYNSEGLEYISDLNFKTGAKIIKPHFLHVFHHFGDKEWAVWRDVEKLLVATEK